MKKRLLTFLLLTFLCSLNHHISIVVAQGTAFTYQGRLNDGASPANGAYDLTFTLFNAPTGGANLGTTNVFDDLVVSNGLSLSAQYSRKTPRPRKLRSVRMPVLTTEREKSSQLF